MCMLIAIDVFVVVVVSDVVVFVVAVILSFDDDVDLFFYLAIVVFGSFNGFIVCTLLCSKQSIRFDYRTLDGMLM